MENIEKKYYILHPQECIHQRLAKIRRDSQEKVPSLQCPHQSESLQCRDSA